MAAGLRVEHLCNKANEVCKLAGVLAGVQVEDVEARLIVPILHTWTAVPSSVPDCGGLSTHARRGWLSE